MHAIPERLRQYLNTAVKEGRLTYQTEASLAALSSFRVGGKADCAVFPKTVDELAALVALCRTASLPYVLIGNGSNVLFDDKGYRGVVIVTTALTSCHREGNLLHCDCGASLTHLSMVAAKAGLGGFAFAYGIPGTLGGAVFMNAGAYGGEMKDIVREVLWYDPETDELGRYIGEENHFGYRESVYQHEHKLILSAVLALSPADPAAVLADMEEYMKRRREKQPLEFPSAGSTFKRYPGYYTGKLIEEAGLKGHAIGGAAVSTKHAGFVINTGGATSADVLALISHIKAVIKERNGIEISCEVRYIPSSDMVD